MALIQERDFGTPSVDSPATVELSIDGFNVTVPEGTSVMRAAAVAGIDIPKLCATDSLKSFGSCRLCLVEVEGQKGTPASCTTPVRNGMRVSTQTQRLEKLRQNMMELYISDHPLECLSCAANGDCDLQDMAGVVGLRDVRYGNHGANHFDASNDVSNPYFSFEPSKCIVCSRCVRACEEIQGTFALTIAGRGFGSKVAAGPTFEFFSSECVSCGACVQACPTAALEEKSVIEHGLGTRTVLTTCAYCGVGCSFKAEMRGDQLIRMVPYKHGGANDGHSCVKGRFAWGYATHGERVLKPQVRESISDPWHEIGWDEAISYAASKFLEIQERHGVGSIGGLTSSRCTNEEVFVVQKMIRAAFGNNNTDTCARVCHSPTGFGLSQTFGTSAGTQDFKSVKDADVVMVIGANPSDAHPVFASRLKSRLRAGAKLIVIDPRTINLVRSPHIAAQYHLQLQPGANVAMVNAFAHVIVHEGLLNQKFIDERCEESDFQAWREFIAGEENSPEALEPITGVDAALVREAARLYATGPNSAIYYGLGVTEHSQGSTMVMGMANLAMATGNLGRSGVGVNPLRGQNNVQGSCDMGSFPHEFAGYRHVSDDTVRKVFEELWGRKLDSEPGLRISNMLDGAIAGSFKGIFIQGEDIVQSDPNTNHVMEALGKLEFCVVQDLFLNETSKFAHMVLPGTSFLEKDGTFTNAERRMNRVRPVMAPRAGKHEWEVTCELATAMGYPMHYDDPSEILDEIARTTPVFAGVSFEKLDQLGSVQWPCTDAAPEGTPIMHVGTFVRGKGRFMRTPFLATTERTNRRYPLILTTGRILSQYNVGAQTRRTENVAWHPEDLLEISPFDAEDRGITDGDRVLITSRVGETELRAQVTETVAQGVVYTTFHHPVSGTNVVTTENADWATSCPEYKVTAVQVRLRSVGHDSARIEEQEADQLVSAHAPLREDLIRVANFIATNFSHYPHDEAVAGIANHLRRFWAKSMRNELMEHLDNEELHPLVRAVGSL